MLINKARKIFVSVLLALSMTVNSWPMAGMGHSVNAATAGTALQFNGSNQYVTFGTSAGLDTGLGVQIFTIETWFKRTGTGGTTSTGTGGLSAAIPLVTKGRGEAENSNVDMNYFFGIDSSSGKLAADFEECAAGMGSPCTTGGTAGLNHPAYGNAVIQNNIWYHAAVTYDGRYWKFYLNGIQDGTTTDIGVTRYPRWDSIQHAGIGTAMTSTGTAAGYFQGVIDEVRIWNTVRTVDQIQADMNNELTSNPGLIGRWGLNEGSGTVANNSIAGRPNGILINNPTWVAGFPLPDTTPPAAPQNLAAAPGAGTIALTWTANTEADLAGYNIYRSNTSPVPTTGAPLNGSALLTSSSYTDIFGCSGDSTAYFYAVVAVDTSNNKSTASIEANSAPGALPPGQCALQFNGTNQYVTFGQASALGTQTFTLEAWINRAAGGKSMGTGTAGLGDATNGLPQAYPVITKGRGEAETPANINMNYWLGISTTGVIAADFEDTYNGLNHPVLGTTVVPTGTWHHVAVTYANGCWNLYLDGNLEGLDSRTIRCPVTAAIPATSAVPESTSIQHAAIATALQSNGNLPSDSGFFSGAVDEARIWNYARTEQQIRGAINKEMPSAAGLIGRWGMNEGSGNIVTDSAGNNVTGTATNSPAWVTGSSFGLVFDTTPPDAPTNLMASPRPGAVQLEWTANTETDLAGYNVYRGTASPVAKGTPVNSTLLTSPSYLDDGVAAGTQYSYAAAAVDSSGNESALSNEASAVPLPPPPAEALKLGNGNAYIALGNKADTATFTLETWLRRDGTGMTTTTGTGGVTLEPIITNGTAEAETAAADINYFFGINSATKLCADFEEAQGGSSPSLNHPICGTTSLATGTWYHAAATYDGTTWKLYLNGNLDGQLAVGQPANAANTSQLAFGTSMTTGNATAGFFNGTLDEVRIWNYARSQAQIAGTINTKITTPQMGLLGRWGLDEGSGITAGDSSGNNITGIITGSGSSWVAGSPFNAVVNLPPDAPVLVSPGSGATGVSTDTTLSVDVSDPESQPLDVTFYGRPLQSASGADFTLVVIPDTQYYASAYPSIYNAQMSWVANNLATSNIVYVAGLGDNVDTASTIAQWTNADTAYDILDAAGVPYGVAAGNHDGAPSGTANFNTYFGTSRFAGKPYIGGHYGSDNDNHYDLFEASGLKFIVVYIEYDDSMTNTNNAVLQWANGLLQYNSDRRAIVISHNMLQGGTSTAFSAQGQAIYNALKGNSNLFLIMGGHLDVASRRTDTDSGHAIYTLRSDYQSVDSQQSGYLRIMRFSPADGMIYVRTYSPTQNKDYDKADAAQNNFSLPYSMGGAAFQAVGTAAGVSSGSTASVPWSGLANGSQYEWYVVSSDGTHQTSSDIWNFTTAGLNQAPVCEPASLTTAEDTSGRITLSCTDADGDPLTYSIVSDPAHGTLSGTGPEYTYTPAPNYNGPDSFTFKANDGKVDSTAAAASITVSPINDPPVCTSGQLTTAEDTPGDFPLSCTDLEGDALTYGVVTPPAHGLASISGTMLTYTPVANYFGSDRLTFKANDGAADSAVSTVDITVTPVNDAPVCHDVSITTNQGTAGETTSNCTDVDGDPLTYSIVADPQHGTAIVAGSMLRYTPAADFSGTDSFTYQASDGSLPSNEAGVAVAVNAVNTRPSIIQDPADLAVNQNDPATFTAQAGGNPTPKVQWSVSTDGGSTWSDIAGATSTTYSFTAQESDHGSQYRAVFTNDAGTATTNAATLSVNIAPAITAQPGNATVTAGEAASFSAAASGRPSPTVQWESSTDGTTWTVVTGAASETYSFTCQAANNGNQFRAVFANPAGTATTDPVTLTVNFAPNITLQPAGQTVTAGQTAAFSAAASGNPTPVVQWQISEDSGANWSDLAGATSTSYSFTAQAEDNGRLYRAVFVNGVGTPVSSSAATLTVNYPPAAPTGLNATAGSARQIYLAWTDASVNEANFELERSTTGVDGSFSLLAMLNADVTTYSDTGLSFASGYCYRVRATNATGSSDYSNVACATTNPEPNDALDFGSGTAYVTFGNPPALELPRFTLETWFKREGVGTPAYTGSGGITAIPLITKGMHEADGSNVDMNYFLGIDSTTNTLAADFEDAATGANHPVSGTTVIQNDTWHHAAVTFDGTRWQLFLDGHLEAELAVGQQPRSDSIQHAGLGVAMNSIGVTEGHFDGVMDEVRIWNYPRTQAQIQGTINIQVRDPQTGLVARYGMDEGTGTTISSTAGTALSGTITGSGYSWVAGAPFNLNFNHMPNPPTVVSPVNGATGVGTNATLSVTASDPDSDPLTVTFYGRPTTGASGPGFTLVALPDTQNYTTLTGGSATFNTMTQWVVDNQSNQNIVFTSHLGDITESGNNDTTETQWQIANTAMSKLEKGTIDPSDDVPFGVVAGNHDVAGGTSLFEKYFGVARFSGRPYYGGHYGTDNLNSYSVFNTTGMSFIVLNLQCTGTTPPTAVLDWADGLLKADLNRRGIVVCHTLFASTTALSVEGTVVFNALNDNPNLFLMLGGHVAGVGQLALKGMDGHTINLLLSDFQGEANGGNGWLRIIKFSPATNQIHITTYSPTLNQYKTDAANQFDLDYPMAGASFSQVGTASIDSGGTASVSWTGLNPSNQYEWYATVSDGSGSTSGQTWSFTTISNSAPTIVSQPTSQTVTAGQQVSFSAAADGQPSPSVQWQVSTDNGLTWSDLTGATSTTYSFTAQAADNGKQYRAVFTNVAGSAVTSTATLTVNYAPTITIQPTNQTVNAGQSVTFTTAARGNPAPTAQWQVSTDNGVTWNNVQNATNSSYSFTAQAADNGSQYRVVFTNDQGAVPSDSASLTVNTAPVITAHPQSITAAAGQAVSFSAAADGCPAPTVQWQISTNNGKAWKNIIEAVSSTYSFTAQTTDSGKLFRAVFTNSLGSATTSSAKLTVSNSTAPVVTTQPADQTVADGQTASFTAAASGNPSPTVQWQVSSDGTIWSNIPGATATTYSFTVNAMDNGNRFRAVFTNSTGSATSNVAILTVNSNSASAPVITFQPASKSVKVGTQVTFTAAASGSPTPSVQWQVSTNKGRTWTAVAGATSPSYTFTAQKADSGNQYRAVFTNSAGSTTSNAATLTVR